MAAFVKPTKFGLLGPAAYENTGIGGNVPPLSAAHLYAQAAAANWLTTRDWRWFNLAAQDALPNAGAFGSGGEGFFSPSSGPFAPFGRLEVPKAPGYNKAVGRIHIRVAPQTAALVTVNTRTSKGQHRFSVGPGNWDAKVELAVDPGTEDAIEIDLTSKCDQLMSGLGTNTFVCPVAFPIPTGQQSGYYHAEKLDVFKRDSTPFVDPFPPHTLDTGGYDVEFYDSTSGWVAARRRVIDHYYLTRADPDGQYLFFEHPLTVREMSLMGTLRAASRLSVRVKERARWTIPSVMFWLTRE